MEKHKQNEESAKLVQIFKNCVEGTTKLKQDRK